MSDGEQPVPSRIVVVDGEEFEIRREGDTTHCTWLTGPNPGYGFSSHVVGPADQQEIERRVEEGLPDRLRSFLAEVDPHTGYLHDDRADA